MINGVDMILSGTRIKRRQERVGSVAANPDNLENSKEAGEVGTRYPGLNVQVESVFPLSRLIRGFRNKSH